MRAATAGRLASQLGETLLSFHLSFVDVFGLGADIRRIDQAVLRPEIRWSIWRTGMLNNFLISTSARLSNSDHSSTDVPALWHFGAGCSRP